MKKSFVTISLLAFVFILHGQIIQSTQFVKGSISDGEKMLGAYLLPLERSFNVIGGSGLVQFHQNNRQRKVNYSFGLQFVGAIAPESDKQFDVNELDLSEFEPNDATKTSTPTFAGNGDIIQLGTRASYKTPTSTFPFYASKPILTLDSPEGMGSSLLTLANLTASICSKSWQLTVRAMPPIKVPNADGRIYSAGAAIQTEINTLFDALQKFPVGITFLTGLQYTKLSLDPGLAPDPSKTEISLQADNGPYDNQKFNVISRAIPFELYFNKQVKSFLIYAGAGFIIAKTTTELKGNIPLYQTDPTNTFQIIIEDFEDPISYSRQSNSLQANIGVKYFYKSFGINTGFYFSKYQSFYLGFDVAI